MDNEKQKALALFLEVEDDAVEVDGDNYTCEGKEYRVLTDDEADKAEDEQLDSYLDDCVLSELPENLRFYFDTEKWKADARLDGRGNSISTYDNEENEQEVEGTTYYIYRTN